MSLVHESAFPRSKQNLLSELIKSKQVSGFYVVSPSKYNLHALFLHCKLLKHVMFADSSPCNQSGLPVCVYGHACAYLHLHAWHIHLCMCAYMCFCSNAQPSCRPLGFCIAPLSCLLNLMSPLLLCFLWSEASQSCILRPSFWSLFPSVVLATINLLMGLLSLDQSQL